MALLLHLNEIDEAAWRRRMTPLLGGMPIYLRDDAFDPADITYILAWKPAPDAFEGLVNLKAVLSLGAGVDALLQHKALPAVPIVRFIDEELSQCMSDYIVANVMMHQRLIAKFEDDSRKRVWSRHYPAAAWGINVGMMGLGVLGCHALERLQPMKLNLFGWARSQKQIDGVTCYAGMDQLDAFLGQVDILVCLLPLTPETTGILNYANFKKLRRDGLFGGPVVINAARGGHQIEADLVKALGDGTLSAASLDVFEVEPLPEESALWDLPNCFVTPHIAAISSPDAGARYFSKVINDHAAGLALPNVVDTNRGY